MERAELKALIREVLQEVIGECKAERLAEWERDRAEQCRFANNAHADEVRRNNAHADEVRRTEQTWYFGPDDGCCGEIWIADNPDGLLDDNGFNGTLDHLLPPGIDESCESIFEYWVDGEHKTYEDARLVLIAAGFVEVLPYWYNNNEGEE